MKEIIQQNDTEPESEIVLDTSQSGCRTVKSSDYWNKLVLLSLCIEVLLLNKNHWKYFDLIQRSAWRVSLVEPELLTLPVHYWGSCCSIFSFCVVFCGSLFVPMAIVLYVLRFTDSDYPFGIFKLFLQRNKVEVSYFYEISTFPWNCHNQECSDCKSIFDYDR